MQYEEVKRIQLDRKLENYLFFQTPNYESNHVGILRKDNSYEVFST